MRIFLPQNNPIVPLGFTQTLIKGFPGVLSLAANDGFYGAMKDLCRELHVKYDEMPSSKDFLERYTHCNMWHLF